jgi:cytoskeletal protein CcmA (bactofilin family)
MMGKPSPSPEITTLLGEGARFEGQLAFEGVVRIDGHFKGKIEAKSATLIIGENGRVEADGALGQFVISGAFVGAIQVSGLTRILARASFEGQLETGALVTEEGARINAQVSMPRAEAKLPQKK